MLGKRIKQARTAAGLSLRDLAEKAGITAMAISKYEREESTPSSKVLLALGKALGVRTEYFFRQTEVTISDPDYRKHDGLSDKAKNKILAEVHDQIERWLELEAFLPTPWSIPFEIPEGLQKKITSLGEIEDIALAVRTLWKLGLNPISDLIDTFEERGIKVFSTNHHGGNKFFGLALKANGMPVVVISNNTTGDRQRFTLAHELGHLILKGRLPKNWDQNAEEQACNRFAGAFLVPQEKVFNSLGNRRTWLEPQELYLLKHEWGLSMGGWMYRASDLKVLSSSAKGKLWGFMRKNFGLPHEEPGEEYLKEEPILFEQYVYRALAENLIGESKAAELMGKGIMEFHAFRNMERIDASNNQ